MLDHHLGGYLGAVIMHGLWNGSSLLSVQSYFVVYVLWMVPIFAPGGQSDRLVDRRFGLRKLIAMPTFADRVRSRTNNPLPDDSARSLRNPAGRYAQPYVE
jgi:hypothetical protein